MDRRRFLLTALAGAFAAPLAAGAQQAVKVHRIGWLSTEGRPDPFVEGFREGLRGLGYVEGQNYVLELRYAPGDLAALRTALTEMAPRVAFIVASGPAIQAAKIAKGVTVLFAISGDPVELGIAQTLARPGGDFTGSTFLSLDIAAKRVELLKEAFPRMRTLAMLSNTNHPGERSERRATEAAAQGLGVSTIYAPFAAVGELDGALTAIGEARPDAMVVFPDGSTIVNREKIAQFAAERRLPSMFGWAEYCGAGGFMCYGANQRETYVRLAAYADRLLRGIKAADIPIEQPTKFELIINLKTAKALGLTIPPSLLARADQVIE
jgi:putative ABC transport system substrate-binding protein